MSKEDLEQRKADVENRFHELADDKIRIEDELKRLEGEYRVLVALINGDEKQSSTNGKRKRMRKVSEGDIVEENATN